MWRFLIPAQIRIEIPALDNLISYLRESDRLKAELDAQALKLNQATNALQTAMDQIEKKKEK